MVSKSERFELRMDEEQLSRIDDWAHGQQDRPTRAEAVRRLMNIGLSAGSSRAVHFSDGNKMIILMLADIYKKLKIEHSESEIDPEFLKDVIYGGHYWAPKWDMQGVFHDQVDNPEEVKYVVNVLEMWSFIEEAYEQFDALQKTIITEEAGVKQVKFPGFDGNNESNQMSIAQFLINKMNRFPRFKNRNINSHRPTRERYCHMLKNFEQIPETWDWDNLDIQQLIKLLKHRERLF